MVTGSVTVMPNIRTSASQRVPTPIGPSSSIRIAFISVIQRGWSATSARAAQTRLDRRVDDDERADRLGLRALRLLGEDAIDGIGDAGAGEGQPDRAADHRITVRQRVTPAASISASARSPSPASRSTAAMASVRTDVWKPSAAASMRGRLDAVVGGEPGHDDGIHAGVAKQRLELGGDGLAGDRVAHREARIAVLAVGALADPWRVIGECQVGMELRAPRVGDAVDRPDAAVLGEVRRGRRVPVLGGDDDRAVGAGHLDLAVDRRDDRVTAADGQAARGVGEIVLDVDDDEGGPGPVALHAARRSAPAVRRCPDARRYPMSADRSSTADGATVSGGTGGSTSSR